MSSPITDAEVLGFVRETIRPHCDTMTLALKNAIGVLIGAAALPSSAGNGQTILAALNAADPTAIVADRPDEPAKQVTVAQVLFVLGFMQTIRDALTANGNAGLLTINTLAVNPRASITPASVR